MSEFYCTFLTKVESFIIIWHWFGFHYLFGNLKKMFVKDLHCPGIWKLIFCAHYLFIFSCLQETWENNYLLNTGRKIKVHKTFWTSYVRSVYTLCPGGMSFSMCYFSYLCVIHRSKENSGSSLGWIWPCGAASGH